MIQNAQFCWHSVWAGDISFKEVIFPRRGVRRNQLIAIWRENENMFRLRESCIFFRARRKVRTVDYKL